MKYIFVTGGVVSSLGKGLAAASLGTLLEARGLRVDRRPGLGATEIAFRALRTDAIDVYPEYTGTGLLAILGQKPMGGAASVYQRVSREFPATTILPAARFTSR